MTGGGLSVCKRHKQDAEFVLFVAFDVLRGVGFYAGDVRYVETTSKVKAVLALFVALNDTFREYNFM